MKKLFALICAMCLCASLCVGASAAFRKIGYTLYTDIVATIDGHPIRSYNIDGYTAVVAEDLRGYGFSVLWDGTARTLRIARAMRDGERVTPETWPDYSPGRLTHRIGSRAKAIYDTDIKTYIAGELEPDSFNVNGETLVWVDDLAHFGKVVWHPDERVIALTLGDPVELAIAPQIAALEAWRDTAGANSSYETYPCATGTLLVTRYTGTPHGSLVQMLFARKNGECFRIPNLLPPRVYSVGNDFAPRQIEIDETGRCLRFVTPITETTGEWPESLELKHLGDHLCVVDLVNGTLTSMQPLSEGLTDWSVHWTAEGGDALTLTVARSGAAVEPTEGSGVAGLAAYLDENGAQLVHTAALLESEAFAADEYGKAFEALRALGLPDAMSGGDMSNTPEQRASAARYFRVTRSDGEVVTGDLWWSQGNNHIDLNFTFDAPLALKDGESLTLTVMNG